LERFLNPSSPDRIRSLIFHERRSAMTVGRNFWRNRKERKEWARRLQSEDPGLEVVHPQSAGIDVGIHIPKENGKQRPISIPALEDKIVQKAMVGSTLDITAMGRCEK
jgi:hypothetical protein